MSETVIEFMRLYFPRLIEAGFTLGAFIGVIAVLSGYGIKQALRFFDK